MQRGLSNKKCSRCKEKHLKCNANRPHCDRCVNAGIECPGYNKSRKFVDQSASLRRRYAPGPYAGPARGSGQAPQNKYFGKFRISRPAVDKAGPRGNSSPADNNTATQNETTYPDPSPADVSSVLNVMSPLISRPESNTSALRNSDRPINTSATRALGNDENGTASISSTANSPAPASPYPRTASVLENTGAIGPTSSSSLNRSLSISTGNGLRQEQQETFGCSWSKAMLGPGDDLAFLLRHYTDVIGPWLDLSDSDQFFSVHVPLRAHDNMALKLTMAAISAKHLGQMKEMNPLSFTTGELTNFSQVDWVLKCSSYYALAISGIAQETSMGVPISDFPLSTFPVEAVSSWIRLNMLSGSFDPACKSLNDIAILRKAEELLAMLVLLKLYELMGTDGHKWPGYLSGIRVLFDLLVEVYRESDHGFSHGIRSSFWNFVRQDFYGSYFTRSASHLDPEDTKLWRCAGVELNEDDKFSISPRTETTPSKEDQASNGVTWIVFKIINFLAKVKQAQLAHWAGSPYSDGGPQNGPSDYPDPQIWLHLCFELQEWLGTVPETFRPSLRIEQSSETTTGSKEQTLIFPEMMFGLPSCATAIQHYHFGRIALLLNQPTDPINSLSVSFDRLHGYREVTKEVEFHVREICGVALGRPHSAVRLPMIPILYAVGQCLVHPHERQILVDLLQGVEADLAWPTSYAVRLLQASWNR